MMKYTYGDPEYMVEYPSKKGVYGTEMFSGKKVLISREYEKAFFKTEKQAFAFAYKMSKLYLNPGYSGRSVFMNVFVWKANKSLKMYQMIHTVTYNEDTNGPYPKKVGISKGAQKVYQLKSDGTIGKLLYDWSKPWKW